MDPNEALSSADPRYPGAAEAHAEKVRLLLADDNPAMLRQVCAMLAKDFEIVAAVADGEAVLQKCRELKPQALILDISMGAVSGLEVARLLRGIGNIFPIVFLTVHQDADFVKAALACGGSAYVVKSHLTNDLIPAIRAALAGKLFVSPCFSQLS
ncbi:MAG: response regulator transcription factor [Acidobacteriia bacterium]|nr:response regulator transcription factor [Terriglobia bacterium]